MKKLSSLILLLTSGFAFAQIDDQERVNSDSRQYYVWSDEVADYVFKETEYEHSIIDIREIGSKSNGYAIISLTDNGRTRTYHGSITDYLVNDKNEEVWMLRSKTSLSKLIFNPEKKTYTFSYENDKKRFRRIFVFKLSDKDKNDTAATITN